MAGAASSIHLTNSAPVNLGSLSAWRSAEPVSPGASRAAMNEGTGAFSMASRTMSCFQTSTAAPPSLADFSAASAIARRYSTALSASVSVSWFDHTPLKTLADVRYSRMPSAPCSAPILPMSCSVPVNRSNERRTTSRTWRGARPMAVPPTQSAARRKVSSSWYERTVKPSSVVSGVPLNSPSVCITILAGAMVWRRRASASLWMARSTLRSSWSPSADRSRSDPRRCTTLATGLRATASTASDPYFRMRS